GGFGTWDALRRFPNVFAAGAPASGGGNVDQGALFAKIPIWAYHGDQDQTVPTSATDQLAAAIAAAGGTQFYYTRPGLAHGGWSQWWDNVTYHNTAGQTFDQWMFAQQKPAPVNTFYVSPTGNDANNGTDPLTPWKTLAKVNATVFAPGDTILFQRGGEWHE